MTKAYINNQQVSADALLYDQWFYKKYDDSKTVFIFLLIISYADFVQKLQSKYEALIEEMEADDSNHKAEDFFMTSYGVQDYPSFENLIKSAENGNYKIEFLSDFFAEEIFNAYTNSKISEKPMWIIHKLTSVDNDGNYISIFGEAQQIM